MLHAEGVTVRFGATTVLDAVSLRVAAGEIVGLVGDNGAGKTTLVRALAGDVPRAGGLVEPEAERISVVWQDVELVDELSIAENLVLGLERGRLVTPRRTHEAAKAVLGRLRIDLGDLARPVATLSGGQRRIVAIARQVATDPAFLLLDEPTTSLGHHEAAAIVALVERVRASGVGVLLVSHDLELVTSLADRLVVLRRGRVSWEGRAGDVDAEGLAELVAGGEQAGWARHELSRLAELSARVSAGEAEAGVDAITAACSAALGSRPVATYLADPASGLLSLASLAGASPSLRAALGALTEGPAGVLVRALAAREVLHGPWPAPDERASELWVFPIEGTRGAAGVMAVVAPRLEEREARRRLSTVVLYAANIAMVVERERALAELARRNRVLEVLRQALEVLAGGADVEPALERALDVIQTGIGASSLELRAVDAPGRSETEAGWVLERLLVDQDGGSWVLRATFEAPPPPDAEEVLAAAANSVRLALERRKVERAEREAAALRRSQALQRAFVQRLSHELRTPLTAITGYASSLLVDDVDWDEETERRFLRRIATESQRLGRLVNDLLDLSAIESGTLRMRLDWADLAYVVEAAVACVPDAAASVELDPDLPPVLIDHERIEQVLVNLLHNASAHNPKGTRIWVRGTRTDEGVLLVVGDDGPSLPDDVTLEELARKGRSGGGHGLGLAIAASIVAAHGGTLRLVPSGEGKRFEIVLPEQAEVVEGAPLIVEEP